MPLKNAISFMRDCIDSVINRTFQNWELITVNDHSRDGGIEILQNDQSKDQRITSFPNDVLGIFFALRLAYSYSSGDLIIRMDADDLVAQYKFSVLHQNRTAKEFGHLAISGVRYFYDGVLGDGYKKYHVYWRMYGLDFRDHILEKLYYKITPRVRPGLKADMWDE